MGGKEQVDFVPPPTTLSAVRVTATVESIRIDDVEYKKEHSSLWQALAVVMLELSSLTDAE